MHVSYVYTYIYMYHYTYLISPVDQDYSTCTWGIPSPAAELGSSWQVADILAQYGKGPEGRKLTDSIRRLGTELGEVLGTRQKANPRNYWDIEIDSRERPIGFTGL